MSAGWEKFNEQNPFGKRATVVGGDNIAHSAARYQAIKAMREGRATPEQMALVHETQTMIHGVMERREED